MATALATLVPGPTALAAPIVDPGWSLFQTDPATTSFFGFAFEGVPLGDFDFGGTIGLETVGPTDTIIRRLSAAADPSAMVATVVDAFQLRSVGEVSILGGPLGIYYLTLSSARGGPASTGTMTIGFGPEGDPHGTYSSSFDLFVDIRLGSGFGPILDSRLISIPDSGAVPWRHEPTGPIQIPGVNVNLNGVDSQNDLWAIGMISKTTPNGSIGSHNAGAVPDAGGSLLLFGLALAGIGCAKAARREQ